MDETSPVVETGVEGCSKALHYLADDNAVGGPSGDGGLSGDYARRLTELMHLVVPSFADACTVDLIQADGSVQRFAYFRNVHQCAREWPAVPATNADTHCIRVPLSDGIQARGTMEFVREPKTRAFDADDRLDAKRLAGRVFSRVERCTQETSPEHESRHFTQASAILAHELRNPLNVFKTAIDQLSLEPDADPCLHKILDDQIKKMTRLVDDLLEMSRHQCGKAQLRKERCQLQAIIDEVLQGMAPALGARCQSIQTSVEDKPIWLHADPLRISQVIVNLLSNASKYSEKGSVIQLIVEVVGDSAEIRVIDKGVGIAPEELSNVFEFFSQSKNSLGHSDGGLGIGLGLVRSLVLMHGGSVQAFSRGRDQGSEFVVRLPIYPGGQVVPVSPAEPYQARPYRVLIVDDRPDNLYLLSTLIKKVGPHEPRSAADGISALVAMETFRPDVVILDIGMPGMNGLEVARKIRAVKRFDEVLLVAVTGHDRDDIRRQSLAAGFDIFQLKPVSLDTIREIMSHPKLSGLAIFRRRRLRGTTQA